MNLYVVTVPFAVQMNLACKNELKNLCFSPTVSYLCYLTLRITIHAILSAITCHASCRMQTKEGKTEFPSLVLCWGLISLMFYFGIKLLITVTNLTDIDSAVSQLQALCYFFAWEF